MGQSTDALIAFGFDLGEDLEAFEHLEGFEDDPDDFIEKAMGIPEYGDPTRPSYDEVEKLRQAYPVELIRHCSCDYPMYFLAVTGTKKLASRGSPVVIDTLNMAVPLDRFNAFMAWCVEHGIDVPEGDPRWYLFSDWC